MQDRGDAWQKGSLNLLQGSAIHSLSVFHIDRGEDESEPPGTSRRFPYGAIRKPTILEAHHNTRIPASVVKRTQHLNCTYGLRENTCAYLACNAFGAGCVFRPGVMKMKEWGGDSSPYVLFRISPFERKLRISHEEGCVLGVFEVVEMKTEWCAVPLLNISMCERVMNFVNIATS